jgi:hypothetical protein
VWVGGKKIAAIGVGASRFFTKKQINEKNAFLVVGASRFSLDFRSFGGRKLTFFQGADE